MWKCILGIGTPIAVAAVFGGFSAFLTVQSVADEIQNVHKEIERMDERGTARLRGVESETARERGDIKTHVARIEERVKSVDRKIDQILNKLEGDE